MTVKRKSPPPAASVPAPGYSGKSLAAKVGLKDGQRVSLVDAPPEMCAALEAAELDLEWKRFPASSLDCVILFAPDLATLRAGFARAAATLVPAGMLWVAWPKKSSGVRTDLTENVVRAHGLECGLVDVKVCAMSDVWSGLKFVRRLADR
jgi:hypothetical protein